MVIHGEKNHPVTLCVSRKVRPGFETDYEDWLAEIIELASAQPGYLGVDVLKPSARTGNDYVIIFRFDSYAHCRAWELSKGRAAATAKLEGMIEGVATVKQVTGLEFWFELPEIPAGATASRHKMAITVAVVIYALALAVQGIFGAHLAELPLAVRLLVVVTIQVSLMTYVLMPAVTKLLKPWLYGASE